MDNNSNINYTGNNPEPNNYNFNSQPVNNDPNMYNPGPAPMNTFNYNQGSGASIDNRKVNSLGWATANIIAGLIFYSWIFNILPRVLINVLVDKIDNIWLLLVIAVALSAGVLYLAWLVSLKSYFKKRTF